MTFTLELINIIKKDMSIKMESLTKYQVDQLVASIGCHIKIARVRRFQREGVLKTINRYWGFEITGFFCNRNESEKTFR